MYDVPSKYEILIKVVIGEFGLLSEPLNSIHLKWSMRIYSCVCALHCTESSFHVGMQHNRTERNEMQYVIQYFPKLLDSHCVLTVLIKAKLKLCLALIGYIPNDTSNTHTLTHTLALHITLAECSISANLKHFICKCKYTQIYCAIIV